jgi:hypothetical protein
MNRMRHGGTRRFSLVKIELPTGDQNSSTTGFTDNVKYLCF